MATTYARARKQRIDALVNSGDEGTSLLQDAWIRLKASPLFWVGAVIVGLFLLLAIIAPWIAPHDPGAQLLIGQTSRARNAIAPAQPGFPLGGDTQGRDLFSRMIVGARQTLLVGILATADRADRRADPRPAGRRVRRLGGHRRHARSSTSCCPFPACCWPSRSACCSPTRT